MSLRHIALAVMVTVIWGFNFAIIKLGLQDMPPLLLSSLRFALAAVPAVFFVPKPQTSWSYLLLFGVVSGILQFTVLFFGIQFGMSAGLASVVLQLHVFFTILLSFFLLRESLAPNQILGMLIAFGGIGVIGTIHDATANLPAVLLVVAAAFSWAVANILTKKAGRINMLGWIVWSSLVPPIPLFLLSLAVDGTAEVQSALSNISWVGVASVVYIAYPTTVIGYGIWSWLLSGYKAGTIVPFTLLVPIFGMLGSVLIFAEQFSPLKLAAVLLVLLGLTVNVYGARGSSDAEATGFHSSGRPAEGDEFTPSYRYDRIAG
jgi:O-acetylserine/cysteine efflux transporter